VERGDELPEPAQRGVPKDEEAGDDAEAVRREAAAGKEGEEGAEGEALRGEDHGEGLLIPDDYVIEVGEGDAKERYRWDEAKELLRYAPAAIQLQKEAIETRNHYQRALQAIIATPREALFQALTTKHKGDTNGAWNEMLDLASGIVNDRINFDNLPPADKRAVMLARELEDTRAELDRLSRDREEEERSTSERQAYNAVHAEIVREIDAAGYEADDEELIAEVAETLALAHETGYDYVDARRAVREVIEVRTAREAELVKRLKVENLPEELVEKVLKHSVEKFKKSPPPKSEARRRTSSGAGEEPRSRRVSGLRSARY